MISKENAAKFIATGIYSHKSHGRGWCRNGTFIPHFYPDSNELYMRDSYFDDSQYGTYEVTDATAGEWKLVIDLAQWSRIHSSLCWDYNGEDYMRLATDSGGWDYAHYYLKNGAQPNIDKQIANKQSELDSFKRQVVSLEEEIARLKAKKESSAAITDAQIGEKK